MTKVKIHWGALLLCALLVSNGFVLGRASNWPSMVLSATILVALTLRVATGGRNA